MKRFVFFSFLLLAYCDTIASELPSEVQSYISDREGCDHFRGEPWDWGNEPNVKERREFIFKNLKELCTGTDKRLAKLRQKYRNDRNVIEHLSDFENAIESQKGSR
jgi:hypothetical protein